MSKKAGKKVSVNKMDEITKAYMPESHVATYTIDGETIDIKINPFITLAQKGQMIEDIVSLVFVNGMYAPYMLRFAIALNKLKYFTDMNISENAEKVWAFIQASGIEDEIDIWLDSYHDIENEVMDLIEFRKQLMLKDNSMEELIDTIITIAQNFEAKFKNIDPVEVLNTTKKIANLDESKVVNAILDTRMDSKVGDSDAVS